MKCTSGDSPDTVSYTHLDVYKRQIYYVKGNGTKNLDRFRLRTPTTSNIPPMVELLKGCQLADVPLIILTIDPCISCTER